MKKIALIASLLTASVATTFAQTWTNDKAHSRLGWAVTHMTINEIDGGFTDFKAVITSAAPDFSDATIELTANVASMNSGVEMRDKHLKSPDFFDAEKFPTLTFKSASFKKTGDKKYQVSGTLTMHGVSKPVTLDAVYNGTITNPQNQKTIAGFKFTGSVKRTDFGIAPGFPSNAVSDDVAIVANGEFIKD